MYRNVYRKYYFILASNFKYNPLNTQLDSPCTSSFPRACWCGLTQQPRIINFVPGAGRTTTFLKMDNKRNSNCNSASNSPSAERARSEDKTDIISSDDSITVVEINRDESVKTSKNSINDRNTEKDSAHGHENKAFVHTEETTSGSSSGSSTSSPEPPVNFELKDMSPQCQPKIMSSNSMEKVPIDDHDGLTTNGKDGRFGDDYLISINEHQKTGLK